jgi:ABC-2 type transport system permease protein
MAVSLVTRMTRRNEELGRLEALVAGRIGRATPLLAAILVALGAETVTTLAMFASLAGAGVPVVDGALYALSLGALGVVFLGLAALGAQLVHHARGVYAIGFGAIIAAYLLRGFGDVRWSPLTWLSPLGWQEETRAFGDQRWWPLLLPLIVAGGLASAALAISARRDVGSALFGAGAADPDASRFLRTPLGIALRAHRGSLIGWTAATAAVSATYGSVAHALIDAINGNPSIATAMGASGSTGLDAVLAMTALLLALLGAGYAVQAVGVLRAEEAGGRLEARLAGARSRWRWLSVHLLVVATGIVLVSMTGAAVLAASTSWSVGDNVTPQVFGAVVDFLPAVVFFAGLAVLVFAVVPRWGPVVWLVYAAGVVIAYLSDPLDLAQAIRVLSPFHLIGNPPVDPVDPGDVMLLGLLAVAAVIGGYAAFRRRGIPQA